MRRIGSIENGDHAAVFSDFLYASKGIRNSIEQEQSGGWAVWVESEDQLNEARSLLDRFARDPDNPEYADVTLEARARKKIEQAKAARARNRHVDVRTTFARPMTQGPAPLTLVLIGICLAVAILSKLGADGEALQALVITKFEILGNYIRWYRGLPEISSGQVWRLLTPVFIHFGIVHLLFNMLWLKDLGGMVESRQGALRLALLVVVIGILSNMGQYLVSGPRFGGMSGVIYGLLGYIWIRGKFDPRSGYYLNRWIVVMLVVWFFLCLTGMVGHIANTAHGVGLGLGMAWGYISSGRLGSSRRR